MAALAAGSVGLAMAPGADSWEWTFAFLSLGVAGLTLAVAWQIRRHRTVSAPSDPRSTSVGTHAAAEALHLVSTTLVAGCLTVAALAAGWAGLVMLQDTGADSWTRLFAFLGLGIAGLALLAGLPHALMLRWVKSHRRSPVSPWPTLAAVTATAIPFPATIMTISSLATDGDPQIQVILLIAALAVLLVVEIILMLHLSQRDKSRLELSSVNHHDDDPEQ